MIILEAFLYLYIEGPNGYTTFFAIRRFTLCFGELVNLVRGFEGRESRHCSPFLGIRPLAGKGSKIRFYYSHHSNLFVRINLLPGVNFKIIIGQ